MPEAQQCQGCQALDCQTGVHGSRAHLRLQGDSVDSCGKIRRLAVVAVAKALVQGLLLSRSRLLLNPSCLWRWCSQAVSGWTGVCRRLAGKALCLRGNPQRPEDKRTVGASLHIERSHEAHSKSSGAPRAIVPKLQQQRRRSGTDLENPVRVTVLVSKLRRMVSRALFPMKVKVHATLPEAFTEGW